MLSVPANAVPAFASMVCAAMLIEGMLSKDEACYTRAELLTYLWARRSCIFSLTVPAQSVMASATLQ